MKPITDVRRRTEYKRPATVGAISVRRTGLSDIYSLTPGGAITVSVDKQSGAYTGAVVYTTDGFLSRFSTWQGASLDDTSDVASAAIPAGATGVAFVCSAVTGATAPRVPAQVSVEDANVDDNRTVHNRIRVYSGDHVSPTFTAFDPTPPFLRPGPGGPDIIFRADVLSSMWLDVARTMPALGTLDEEIEAWDNLGTDTGLVGVEKLAGTDHAFYVPSGLNGRPALRSDGVNTTLEGGAGKSGTFTSPYNSVSGGVSMFAIGDNFDNGGNTVLDLTDGGPDLLGWGDISGFRANRNAGTDQIFAFTGPTGAYFYVNVLDDGTIDDKDFSGSVDLGTTETSNHVAITTAFGEVRIFGNVSGTTGPNQFSEIYILNRSSTPAEIAEFKAYCLSQYGLTKAV